MPKYALCAELKEGARDKYIDMHHHATVTQRLKDINRRAGVTKEQIFLFGNLIFLYGECEDVEKMNAVLAADGLAAQWAEDCDNTVRGASHLCLSLTGCACRYPLVPLLRRCRRCCRC